MAGVGWGYRLETSSDGRLTQSFRYRIRIEPVTAMEEFRMTSKGGKRARTAGVMIRGI